MKDNIAELLIELRKRKGFTQSDLADKLGISFQAVSKWERGENLPDAFTLVELAKIYGITVDEILKGELLETPSINKSKRKKLALMIIGTMIVIVSPITLFAFGVDNYTRSVPALLIVVAIGVGLLVYSSVNSDDLIKARIKTRKQKRKEEIVYSICAGIFLTLGLLFDLFHIAWVVFIFGYAVTLIGHEEE